GSDYELARSWKKETKPVSGPSVHIRKVKADNSLIGINNGSFDVNRKPKKSNRKRKSVCYTLSSEEEDHSSDQDYTEKPKREKLRRKMYSSAPVDNSEKVRDWLLLPDDYFFYDLKPLPEDIDEVI
ncbi:36323_t:CDS:2, partial [Racocetra persica]